MAVMNNASGLIWLMRYSSHGWGAIVVTDDSLVPIWHQAIGNHRHFFDRWLFLRILPT